MTEKKVLDKNQKFVVRHFKEGRLLPNEGWHRFKLTHHINSIKRYIAAASVSAVILAATASLYYYSNTRDSSSKEDMHLTPIEDTMPSAEYKIEKIEFHNATLKEVIAEIERVYDVSISNVPEEEIRMTISYEGTASDVVENLNDLLNINLIVSHKISNKE